MGEMHAFGVSSVILGLGYFKKFKETIKVAFLSILKHHIMDIVGYRQNFILGFYQYDFVLFYT
jgi:hypothetical protein